jgi:transcriptional regulator
MLLKAIVAVEMTVESIEGSFKLNQHKSDEDHVGVAAALAHQSDPSAQAIAKRMIALRPHLDYAKNATAPVEAPALAGK